jgi:hypothetical protein
MNRFTNRMLLYCISILQLLHFSVLSFPGGRFYFHIPDPEKGKIYYR